MSETPYRVRFYFLPVDSSIGGEEASATFATLMKRAAAVGLKVFGAHATYLFEEHLGKVLECEDICARVLAKPGAY